jgi:hypothetical protein
MGEIGRRTAGVVGRAAGNTVGPAVTALMTAAGAVLGHPDLAAAAVPGGAIAGAMTEEGVALITRIWQDKSERVATFADTGEQETGRPVEELIAEAADDPRRAELLARAVEAATSPPKIKDQAATANR